MLATSYMQCSTSVCLHLNELCQVEQKIEQGLASYLWSTVYVPISNTRLENGGRSYEENTSINSSPPY